MPKYRKKPVIVEAEQWDGSYDGALSIRHFLECEHEILKDKIIIKTLEGDMEASPGDWVIKGVKGEFYPCKPDIFEATYERAEDVQD
jgi:hypothetical protein